ncbi:unnamed protein product [Blepharisma stoltei]|uniref:Rab-GAP TBC domain-containing protein n=1 Tax=Blepharisma stoltei TaxID=1481888 RepID=A0AAU9IEE9_9CILI|nr:unnamed protein product [Blepharisma stoltei]
MLFFEDSLFKSTSKLILTVKMGTTCGILRRNGKDIKQVVLPMQRPKFPYGFPPPDLREAGIGPYLIPQTMNDKLLDHLGKWNKMMSMYASTAHPFEVYLKDPERKEKLLRRIKKGPPVQYRWQAWIALMKLSARVNEDAYNKLPMADESVMSTIRRDLDRTFPNHPYFQKEQFNNAGQGALERILGKFAYQHQEIGYCQGMNFIAGFLLMVSGGSEIEVLFALEILCEKYDLKGFFIEGMPFLKKSVWIFNRIFRLKLPKLWQHFQDENVPDDAWILKWFMTVYIMNLNFETIIRIWDCFLIDGIKMLYRVALSILSSIETTLLTLETVEICEALKEVKNLIDPESLITSSLKINISKEKITAIENLYKHRVIGRMSVKSVPPQRPRTEEACHRIEQKTKLPPVKKESFSPQPRPFVMEEIREDLRGITPRRTKTNSFTSNSNDEQSSRKFTQVPTLPDIHSTRKYSNSFREPFAGWADDSLHSESDEGSETIDVKTVLNELLKEKSRDNFFKLKCPRVPIRKGSDIDKKITFINRLPI